MEVVAVHRASIFEELFNCSNSNSALRLAAFRTGSRAIKGRYRHIASVRLLQAHRTGLIPGYGIVTEQLWTAKASKPQQLSPSIIFILPQARTRRTIFGLTLIDNHFALERRAVAWQV